jgi:hypothetical protein
MDRLAMGIEEGYGNLERLTDWATLYGRKRREIFQGAMRYAPPMPICP